MTKYVTVSAKIPAGQREKMRKLGLKPSTVIRKALAERLMEDEAHEIKKIVKKLKLTSNTIPVDAVVKDIREDRDTR